MSVISSNSTSIDQEARRSASEFSSQNISDMIVESSGRTSFLSISQRPNNLRVFTFSELKTASKNFSRSVMIGEGGFGCVYKGTIRSTADPHNKVDVAIKQLGRRGLQARAMKVLGAQAPLNNILNGEGGLQQGVNDNSIWSEEDNSGINSTTADVVDSFIKYFSEIVGVDSHSMTYMGHKEWVTEVNVLGVVEHPNLVKLVGYCAEDDERGIQRLLVYEYMPNRSVADHLSTRYSTPLPWDMRLKVAQDAACGLVYLHEEMDFQIIFRDFKASNILLDEQWNAKLSDFGLARLGPSDGLTHVSTAVVGTIGYAAPEYIQTGRLTIKSDVWSYGVFLYELITGRRPLDRSRPKSEQKLMEWIKPFLSDTKKFQLIIDPRLQGKYSVKSVLKLAAVAKKCLMRHPKARPKMSEVLQLVKQIEIVNTIRSPEVIERSLDPNKASEKAKRKGTNLKRRVVDSKVTEGGFLCWRNWKSKLVRTC
ncbi:hypothetical protein IFM89_034738 [Coptis chinensis]|uniref:Protein kinase domain-containing protein n=1 Tax=Coptis chinensis TaxID=261450 RepID=A0A835H701_9MAGN|nr:hypothetical protein IFM89_034738 [Coptis chinensis]